MFSLYFNGLRGLVNDFSITHVVCVFSEVERLVVQHSESAAIGKHGRDGDASGHVELEEVLESRGVTLYVVKDFLWHIVKSLISGSEY